jgi:penicillin G amidase
MELPKSGFFSTVFCALLRPVLARIDRNALPKYDGELTIPGLSHVVNVTWDNFAIPHVSAANEPDLFLAQGYLHAQERLWQMELGRRFLSGRMAEFFGDFSLPWRELSQSFYSHTSVDFDYFMRLLGIRHAAQATLDQLAEPERLRLHAYAEGVNAYIERCGKRLPWEFRILRRQAEPWSPEDSLTIGKGFALLLSTALYTRLNYIAIADHLKSQPDKLRTLRPYYPTNGPTITHTVWPRAESLWQFTSGLLATSDFHSAGHGSNNWVAAPSRTTHAGAILCNDPHLRMTLPSNWYLMHLNAASAASALDGYEVWGASIPGLPAIQLGHNRSIAWGITAAVCDDVEIYREKIHRLDPDLYLTGDEWRKFDTRRERIAIRGKAAVERIVRQTHHGPVLSDFGPVTEPGEVLSVRWSAHEPSQELKCIDAVNRARDWPEFLAALRYHGAPSLNFLFADRNGNIGYSLAGNIPRRRHIPTLLPVAGWEVDNDWRDYIPFEELPRVYNPPDGALATTNNRISDDTYANYLSQFYEPPHRIRRLEQLFKSRAKFSVHQLAGWQVDGISLHAKELITLLKGDFAQISRDSLMIGEVADLLVSWDGDCSEHSAAAAVFHVFHHRLLVNILMPDLGERLFSAAVEILNQCIVPTDEILANPNSPWFAGSSRTRLVERSLREACAELAGAFGDRVNDWRWGEIHQLAMRHALGRSSVLQPLLGIGPFPAPGNGTTLNLGFYRHSNPYAQTVGPSLRLVIEFNPEPTSTFVLSSGQSGHPSSPHYRDQTRLWQNGQRIPLCDSDQTLAGRLRHLLIKPL